MTSSAGAEDREIDGHSDLGSVISGLRLAEEQTEYNHSKGLVLLCYAVQ